MPTSHSLAIVALAVGLFPGASQAATTLNPQNTGNFTREGQQGVTNGTVLRLTDTSSGDFIAFFANDADASPGIDVDVVVSFQVIQAVPNNADTGARVVINDGLARSAIAACVVISGVRGIGLLSTGQVWNPASYPVFVPVDWQNVTTVRLRRTFAGDAKIVEVNGVAPPTSALLPANLCPAKTRPGASVEFGAASLEAECTVDYAAFRSERAVTAVPLGEHGSGETMISAFPNPTAGALSIAFAVPRSEVVRLAVYDISGCLVSTLWSGPVAGESQSNLIWDGRDDGSQRVAAGTYFLRLESPQKAVTRKVVLLK